MQAAPEKQHNAQRRSDQSNQAVRVSQSSQSVSRLEDSEGRTFITRGPCHGEALQYGVPPVSVSDFGPFSDTRQSKFFRNRTRAETYLVVSPFGKKYWPAYSDFVYPN